jgi:hypothetical protein
MTRMTNVPVKRGSVGIQTSENPTFRAIYGCMHVGKLATRRYAGADHYFISGQVQVGNTLKIDLHQIK